MLQDFVYFLGKLIFNGEFLSMPETKICILMNSTSMAASNVIKAIGIMLRIQ